MLGVRTSTYKFWTRTPCYSNCESLHINTGFAASSFLLSFWGYITKAFTKVLTIYHSRIHPLHHPTLSSPLHSWNSFNRSNFHLHTCAHSICLYLPSHTLSLPPAPHWYHASQTGPVPPSGSLILQKKKTDIFACLR
jgi:hypothetical protein